MLVPCVLWDQSDGGARIAAAYINKLPQVFTLIRSNQPDLFCRVVWRKGALMGVRFVDEAEAGEEIAALQRSGRQQPEATRSGPDSLTLATLGWHPEAAEGSAKGNVFLSSFVAAGFLIVLVALTIIFYFAGHETGSGVVWADRICQEANGMCQHPEFSGGASVLMALVYFAAKGMEMRD